MLDMKILRFVLFWISFLITPWIIALSVSDYLIKYYYSNGKTLSAAIITCLMSSSVVLWLPILLLVDTKNYKESDIGRKLLFMAAAAGIVSIGPIFLHDDRNAYVIWIALALYASTFYAFTEILPFIKGSIERKT